MRAWAVVENGADLQEIELPTPEPTGTEVLLEVTHCGVCHSDLHIWEGYYDMGGGKQMSLKDRGVVLPLAMGHEIIGRVVKLGPDAAGVAVGDVRIVFPWLGCGKCESCLAEEDNMCVVANRSLGVYQNGGYGTHVVAPHPRHLIDLGTLDPAIAATYACSGVTVYSAIRKVLPMQPKDPIVVVGAGGLGLNAIEVLKALGHKAIVAVDLKRGEAASGRNRTPARRRWWMRARRAPPGASWRLVAGRCTRGHRFGERDRDGCVRLCGAAQGRQAGAGRVIWRRDDAAVAHDADAGADDTGQLCRQPKGAARIGGVGAKWRDHATANHAHAAGGGKHRFAPAKGRQGDRTRGANGCVT